MVQLLLLSKTAFIIIIFYVEPFEIQEAIEASRQAMTNKLSKVDEIRVWT